MGPNGTTHPKVNSPPTQLATGVIKGYYDGADLFHYTRKWHFGPFISVKKGLHYRFCVYNGVMINRTLNLTSYNNSLFLFGPRQVGKTSLIINTLSPDIYINLLKHAEFVRYAKDPSLLSKEAHSFKEGKELLIVIDEIQRCPELLNEIQMLIDGRQKTRFVLTGSSARKLRRAGVNLLGGRAITLHLHPFTHEELKEGFSLEDALRFGTIPRIALSKNESEKIRMLKGYVETYLKEEIQQEALTRNIPAFARFLELAAFENGNLLNFQNIAREVGVHAKTVKEYFQILEDTLIGFFLYPYTKSHREKLVSHPKFYFFDRGVVSALKNSVSSQLVAGSPPYGDAFEHWIILEMKRLLDYREREANISFFRTSDGAEVDIVLEHSGKIWAIEIKSSSAPRMSDLRGLKSFMADHKCDKALCVCQTPRPYTTGGVEFVPWKDFFVML